MNKKNNFREDIHALRCVAVLSVLFYHSQILISDYQFFSGGFLGVDIFFVISGYLISSIIYNKNIKKEFQIYEFYERRIKRILPSLLLIILITLIISQFLSSSKENYENSYSALFSIFFSSNYYFMFQDSYTAVSSNFKPLLHTWSLAVEEQFYIFFPIFFIFIINSEINTKRIIFILFFLSLISCLYFSNFYPQKNFFLSTSRFWELLAGTLVFLNREKLKKLKNNHLITHFLWIILLTLLIVFNNKSNHPGIPNLLVVLITSLLLLINSEIKIYKNFVVQFFGNISYTLYLVHWPFFAFMRIQYDILSFAQIILTICLSIFLSSLIFKFYEARLIKINFKKVISLIAAILFANLLFIFVNFSNEQKERYIIIEELKLNIKEEKESRWEYLTNACNKLGWENCYTPQTNKLNILVLGDSMSPDAANILIPLLKQSKKPHNIITDTLGGCSPHPNIETLNNFENKEKLNDCLKLNKKRFSRDYYKNIDVVVINNLYTEVYNSDELDKYLKYLKNNVNSKVIIIGSYLRLNDSFIELIRKNKKIFINNHLEKKFIKSKLLYDKDLDLLSKKYNYFYVSFKELCKKDSCKLFTNDNYPFSFDTNHISKNFANEFGNNYSRRKELLNYIHSNN